MLKKITNLLKNINAAFHILNVISSHDFSSCQGLCATQPVQAER